MTDLTLHNIPDEIWRSLKTMAENRQMAIEDLARGHHAVPNLPR